ncbi:MAG: SxtJ family membrane protein [Acidobacteriota bacterium]
MSILQEVKELPAGTQDLRKFGWTMGIAFTLLWAVVLYLFPYLWGRGHDVPLLWQIGLGFAVIGTVLPIALKPIYFAWMTLALILGYVMTRVLLTIFFFVVLTPVALVFKLIGRDALHRKLDRGAESYWIEKEYLIPDRTRYEKFF